MKKWKQTAGFTLVELIVVIAILGILAGVGTVGYSGYIKKANQAADQQLIAGIKNAIEIAAISDPVNFSGTNAVILSSNGITYSPENDNPIQTAVEAAYGNNTSLKLQYNWGSATEVVQDAIDFFGSFSEGSAMNKVFTGQVKPSYAADVDDLFDLVRDTAVMVGGKTGTTGADLIAGAADITAGNNSISAESFANAWANQAWNSTLLMGDASGNYTDDYIEDHRDDTNFMNLAIANAAVIKARNTSIATYMRDHGYPEYYDAISNYCMGSSTVIPADIVGDAITGSNGLTNVSNKIGTYITNRGGTFNEAHFKSAVISALTSTDGYFATQAEDDALAYYAMMNVVDNVNNEEGKSDESYWNEMAGAVSLYGAIVNKQTSLDDLQNIYGGLTIPDGAVMLTVVTTPEGIGVMVNPRDVLAE